MNPRTIKIGAAAVALLVVGAAAVWGLSSRSGSDEPQLPQELSVASLKAQFEKPDADRRSMRDTFEREDLSDEQRQQARRNMREVFRSMMDERVGEYLDAPPEDKVAVLDRHIDEWTKRMDDWRQERERRRAERERQAQDDDSAEEQRRHERWGRGMGSTEQRKSRSESRSPDETARRMVYFSAMRQRMQERGIESPMGRGRGGGGHGGGGSRGGSRGPGG